MRKLFYRLSIASFIVQVVRFSRTLKAVGHEARFSLRQPIQLHRLHFSVMPQSSV